MMTVHLSLAGGGPDATAWVSAGAAVVQAIGAIVAIWYSGKLARDAAKREIAADAANERRIAEANAAAAEQRRLDREQEESLRTAAEDAEFNAPLMKAAELGDRALSDIHRVSNDFEIKAAGGDLTQYPGLVGPDHRLARDLLPAILDSVSSAKAAAAIRSLQTELLFPSNHGYRPPRDWVESFRQREESVREAIAKIRQELRPSLPSPDLAKP